MGAYECVTHCDIVCRRLQGTHESRESPAGIEIKPPGRIECVGVYLAVIDYLLWSVRSFSVDVFCIVLLLKQSL